MKSISHIYTLHQTNVAILQSYFKQVYL